MTASMLHKSLRTNLRSELDVAHWHYQTCHPTTKVSHGLPTGKMPLVLGSGAMRTQSNMLMDVLRCWMTPYRPFWLCASQ